MPIISEEELKEWLDTYRIIDDIETDNRFNYD